MVVVLHKQGFYPWDEFKERLIAEISSADEREDRTPEPSVSYYEHWLAAFWKLLTDRGILGEAEIEARKAEFESGLRKEAYYSIRHKH
jgi:nitrile hydratase accessory protein